MGESGTSKSPALELALQSVRQQQQEAMREYPNSIEQFENKLAQYKRDLKAWKEARESDNPPAKPNEPVPIEYWTTDATTEAAAEILANQPQGLLVACDELAGFFGSFNRYVNGGPGADAARWIECFHGRSLKINRASIGNSRCIQLKRS